MTPIKRIIKQGKGRTVEFAQSLGEPALIAAHVVGFLNCGGGYIIIGVDHDGRVASVPNADQVAEDLQIYLTQHISPRALFDVGVDLVDDQSLVVIDVPGGKDIPFVTDERVYLRRGVNTVAASGDDLHELLQL
jgi:ATP-dependent DNA helicase RecG